MITKKKLKEMKKLFKKHGITSAILVGEDSDDFAAYYRGTNDLLAVTNASKYYEKVIDRFHELRLNDSFDAANNNTKTDREEAMRWLVG